MTDSPILDYLVVHGVPREQWAVRWIEMNWGSLDNAPESIDGETLGEVVPGILQDEVALYFKKMQHEGQTMGPRPPYAKLSSGTSSA